MGLPNALDPAVDFGLPYEDYSFQVDPQTDVAASIFEQVCVDLSAVSHTVGRAAAYVTAGGTPVLSAHDAVWGNTDAVKPTVTRNGVGDYTLTWASSYDDLNPTPDRRVTHTVNFRYAQATLVASALGAFGFIHVSWTANTVTVKTADTGGTPADLDFVVVVF